MAPGDVPKGAPYAQALVDAISASRVVVVAFSRAANRSEAVLNELELASNRGIPIFAVRLEPIEPSGSAEYYLRRRQWFDADVDFAQHLAEIPAAVRAALEAAAARTKPVRRLKRSADEDVPDRGLIAGRDHERAIIAQLLTRARAKHGGLIILTGEPGIGKTRILQAAFDDARGTGFEAAFVTNFEHARAPLGPWIDVLRTLEPFLPEIVPSAPADRIGYQRVLGVSDETAVPAPDGRRMLVIVAEALQRAAKRSPIFVALDDAQWCDPESIELLDIIIPRLDTARIAIAVGRRPADSDAASPALARLERYPEVQAIAVEPMPDAAIRQLVASLSPRDDAVSSAMLEEICRRSEGNPLFAAELMRDATTLGSVERLPESVQVTAVSRLAAMAPDEARIIETASVIGRVFPLADLEHVAGTDRPGIMRALRSARDTGLIRDLGPGTFAFRHELLRAAIYEHAFSADREETHRAYARFLASRPDVPPALLAYHWKRAGDLEQASRYAIEAGDQAMRINAYASARDRYVDALSAGTLHGVDEAAVEVKAAAAFDALGTADDAAKHFASAAVLFRTAGDTQRAARLDLRFAANAYRAGRASEVERACNAVLAESADPDVLYGAHAILASFFSTRMAPARVHEHIGAAESLGIDGQVRDALSIAWARATIAEGADEFLPQARAAVQLAEMRGTPALHALNLVNFAMLAPWHGCEHAETAAALTRAIEIADANGATYTAAYARCEMAWALHFRGELDAAYRVLLEAAALHVEALIVRIFVASVGLNVLADLGAADRFPAFRDPALLDAAFSTGEPGRFAALAAAHVHASVMTGNAAECGPTIKRALGMIGSFGFVSDSLVVFALHGDHDDRRAIARMLPPTARLPSEELDRVMIRAIVSHRDDEPGAGDAAERALAAARATGAPLFEALACELLGRRRDAAAIYERIGAHGRLRNLTKTPSARRRAAAKTSVS
jgi:hypothetical protein